MKLASQQYRAWSDCKYEYGSLIRCIKYNIQISRSDIHISEAICRYQERISLSILSDINECEFANGGCQEVCTNTEGSFHCSCLDNQQLEQDGFSCAEGNNIWMHYS